jgi:hypothetical protein
MVFIPSKQFQKGQNSARPHYKNYKTITDEHRKDTGAKTLGSDRMISESEQKGKKVIFRCGHIHPKLKISKALFITSPIPQSRLSIIQTHHAPVPHRCQV